LDSSREVRLTVSPRTSYEDLDVPTTPATALPVLTPTRRATSVPGSAFRVGMPSTMAKAKSQAWVTWSEPGSGRQGANAHT
jgi:hypothetical protein